MRNCFRTPALALVTAIVMASPALSADDWSFVAGKYAMALKDCKLLAKGRPFSKVLVKDLDGEVLTREGITESSGNALQVPELGQGGRGESRVEGESRMRGAGQRLAGGDRRNGECGRIARRQERGRFGPPLTFLLCPK